MSQPPSSSNAAQGEPDLRYGPGPHPDDGPGAGWFVVALTTGIPVALLMGYRLLGTVFEGQMPGLLTSLMFTASTAGSSFAVVGMRARPRRFLKAALWLTVPSALVFVVMAVLLVLLIVALASGGVQH